MNLLREDQIERYARHILLREVGGVGQERLLASAVAVEGLGAPGGWTVAWLALAGVGRLHLLDPAPLDPELPLPFLDAAGAGKRRDQALAEAIPAHNPDARCTWGELLAEPFSLRLLVEPPPEERGRPASNFLPAESEARGPARDGGSRSRFWLAASGGVAAMGWLEGAPPCARCAGLPPEPLRASNAARAGSLAASRIVAFLLGLEAPAPGPLRWEGGEARPIPPCPHR